MRGAYNFQLCEYFYIKKTVVTTEKTAMKVPTPSRDDDDEESEEGRVRRSLGAWWTLVAQTPDV